MAKGILPRRKFKRLKRVEPLGLGKVSAQTIRNCFSFYSTEFKMISTWFPLKISFLTKFKFIPKIKKKRKRNTIAENPQEWQRIIQYTRYDHIRNSISER